jgi:hypothetical protein
MMFLRRLWRALRSLAIGLFIILAVAPEWPAFQDESHRLEAIVGQRQFDFLVWEARAVATKIEAALAGGQRYLDEDGRRKAVLDYLALLGRARELEAEVSALYADPQVSDPQAASRRAAAEVARLRSELQRRQPLAEAIVQAQVAAVLADEGFDLLGGAWPPVQMHMTALPYVLVVSPREEIRQLYSRSLQHGLPVAEREAMENRIAAELDRSALVVPIGGLGLYPAMIIETTDIVFLADVVAHEWAHHWLSMRPMGLSYNAGPALRTMNETVASILGAEVGRRVIERFYPDLAPRPEDEQPPAAEPAGPPPFDFNAEMARTRVQVDLLLGQGKVQEAEAYMEARRLIFWDHGYRIRKLNQAYFAFYGAYAETPGEGGADPIGPAILAVRQASPTLRGFMDRMGRITSLEELQAAADSTS